MRTATMSDALHGRLVKRLRDERHGVNESIRLFERNQSSDWKGIPTQNRREQEERLPSLRRRQDELTEFLEALNGASAH